VEQGEGVVPMGAETCVGAEARRVTGEFPPIVPGGKQWLVAFGVNCSQYNASSVAGESFIDDCVADAAARSPNGSHFADCGRDRLRSSSAVGVIIL
jgi:hypothetical protein